MVPALSGAVSGVLVGYVLQRSQQCFHATFAGLYERRFGLVRAWILAVAVASVGLTVVYDLGPWDQLNRGLPFDPLHNVAGGLLIGAGMVTARSCVSGLYFKLGAGMLGAIVALVGWAAGELVVRDLRLPGDTLVLEPGEEATVPGWLGVPRWTVAVPFAVVVLWLLFRRRGADRPARTWQWGWPVAGIALGVATIACWIAAGAADHRFGPSTVGVVSAIVEGEPRWWLVAFLGSLPVGAFAAARAHGGLWVRGEHGSRYVQLAVGGALLGAGGIIALGGNLGHGLSGVSQLSVSSWVVVASIVVGIGLTRALRRALVDHVPMPRELEVARD